MQIHDFGAHDFTSQELLLCYINLHRVVTYVLQFLIPEWFITGPGNLILGSVDSHGHLIVSKLHTDGKGTYPLFGLT